uniref:RNA-binding protein n=1 Tax=Colletotrichum fructicola (strain Nara gc5) TaxID=1213859 RepID=L2GED2_COLFN
MPEPEAIPEFQATAADLSPLSPSPLHSAAPAVVPVLQDTADILDAMSTQTNAIAQGGLNAVAPGYKAAAEITNGTTSHDAAADANANDQDDDDDDSLNAYGEEEETSADKVQEQQVEQDAEDEYLKYLDSQVEEGAEQDDVSKAPESMHNSAASDSLTTHQVVSPPVADPSSARPAVAQQSSPSATATSRDAHVEDDPAIEISQLLTEMTGQASDANDQSPAGSVNASATAQNHEAQPASSLSSSAAAATLPPRPPMPTQASSHYDQFLEVERSYMAEAKWDKFPDGSRIFIGSRSLSSGRPDGAIDFFSGNLSSERVSKRDVFEIFCKYGQLAQISLKSAYGFVQYHNLEDAQAAMNNLQGIEIKGRKIHLEYSKVQKSKGGNERNRSPDRGGRGGRQSGRQDRHEGGHNDRRRDDYRPGRNASPRRNGHARGDSYGRDSHGRDRYYDDRSRGRSRSPQSHGRNDNYRWREPSPPKAYERPGAELDLPRRYGNDVPDVQILLLQELANEFVAWVQHPFTEKGLKVAVMFFNPRFPREALISRLAAEGVHGVVDLDMQAHNYGRIPLRVFKQAPGGQAMFEDYDNIEPKIAAELVLRQKANAAPPYQPPPQQPYPGYGGQPYGGQPPAHAPAYPPQGQRLPPQAVPQAPAVNQADIANIMSGVDNTTLQQLLAHFGAQGGANGGPAAAQIQAMLGGLQAAPAPAPQPASASACVAAIRPRRLRTLWPSWLSTDGETEKERIVEFDEDMMGGALYV